jgi:hypothetical protein
VEEEKGEDAVRDSSDCTKIAGVFFSWRSETSVPGFKERGRRGGAGCAILQHVFKIAVAK